MAETSNKRIEPAEIASLMLSVAGESIATGDGPSGNTSGVPAGRTRSNVPSFALPDLDVARLDRLAEAHAYELPSFDAEVDEVAGDALRADDRADVELQIELGRALLPIDEENTLRDGAVVPLDKLAGDPVDILVDGRVIARGEVLVLDEKFCVRVAEIIGWPFAMEARSPSVLA